MDPCIVDYSVEIPTRYSFVVEFIIPKFFEGSTCFERHTAHHHELYIVFAVSGLYARPLPWQRPVTIWAYKPEAANTV